MSGGIHHLQCSQAVNSNKRGQGVACNLSQKTNMNGCEWVLTRMPGKAYNT